MILNVVEWQYLLASLLGVTLCLVLLRDAWRTEYDRIRRGENGSLALTIRKAIVVFRILLLTLCIKVVVALATLTGHFGTIGAPLLSMQPDIMLFLLWYIWKSDKRIILMRRAEDMEHAQQRQPVPPSEPAEADGANANADGDGGNVEGNGNGNGEEVA